MSMPMETQFTINDLNNVIRKQFGYESCSIVKVEIANAQFRYAPKEYILGVGSILTITTKLENRIEPKKTFIKKLLINLGWHEPR